MHALHRYLSDRLCGILRKRRVMVWYDANADFAPYVAELSADTEGDMSTVQVGDLEVRLARFSGSFFAVRAALEPFVSVDVPDPILIYVPGVVRDRIDSILMELEKAGTCYEPQLKRQARNVLRAFRTDGVIDELLAPEKLTYNDVVALLAQIETEDRASLLKTIFAQCRDRTALLACWLADESKDPEIEDKEARAELFKLISARLGLELAEDGDLADGRARTGRYVLVNEFRSDLAGDPPGCIGMIPVPPSEDRVRSVRELADALRTGYPDAYVALADRVEGDVGIGTADVDATDLGSIDTFRFEERLLLAKAGELIAEQQYADALAIIDGRGSSFWVDTDVARQAQWEAARLMAELGGHVDAIEARLGDAGKDPAAWLGAYTDRDGWYRADLTHRALKVWVTVMDDDPETEQALAIVEREYEELLKRMTEGFSASIQHAGWSVPGALVQTQIYSEVVEPMPGRTAYFLVDAMRYEMGVELAGQLEDAEELSLRPAIAALPTITDVGMAALFPGASASFSVVDHEGQLAVRIQDASLRGLAGRQKLLKASAPGAAEMSIGRLLQMSKAQLRRAVGDAELVVVRSQEIDALGESGDDWLARQTMDTMVGNVARAVRKLARLGIERFVITSDHGHQFAMRKDEDMRTDSPGGDTLEIHRRCWVGRGGQTPPSCMRVSGAELGYETDLDFVFPSGLAVFRTAGGLSYHHGGCSLQELVIPVLSLRFPTEIEEKPDVQVSLSGCPTVLTNRTFGITITVQAHLYSEPTVALLPVIVSGDEHTGGPGMAQGAEFDRATGRVHLVPGQAASVGMMLTRDDCETVRIVIQDPVTDAVLAQSDEIPVRLAI